MNNQDWRTNINSHEVLYLHEDYKTMAFDEISEGVVQIDYDDYDMSYRMNLNTEQCKMLLKFLKYVLVNETT